MENGNCIITLSAVYSNEASMGIIDLLSEIQKASQKSVTLDAWFCEGAITGYIAHAGESWQFEGWTELRGIVDRLCDKFIVCEVFYE
jgi:hypothetical protein